MRSFQAITALTLLLSAASCTGAKPAPVSAPKVAAPVAEAAVPLSTELVAHFDPAAGELPEGLVLNGSVAYVGFAPTSRVVRVDVGTGATTAYGQLPPPVAGKGFMTGLAQSAEGEVYAGLASFVPEVQAGIYRIPKSGGTALLFAKDAALPFPNALAFDHDGSLWATDSGTGSVFQIDRSGRAQRWATGDALMGRKESCGSAGPGFAIGANGIVVERDAVYVVNMDQATLVKIPRDSAGNAGAPSLLAGPDCAALGGADGLTRAPDGSFVIAVNRQNKIVRVRAGGVIETIAIGAPLDFPATVAYRGSTLYATNFALKTASAGKPSAPGLLRVRPERQ
jgi:sugar lactone lactonase YvrE